MEIKNLKYFLAVAREENMSKAAEQLHGKRCITGTDINDSRLAAADHFFL